MRVLKTETDRVVACMLLLAACGGSAAQRPRTEDSTPLVIPPLGPDAGSAPLATATSEPADTRSAVTIPARDPRLATRRPRSRAVLLTEVQGLERLLASRKPDALDRPQLRRRLAEAYNELAYTASGADAVRARDESIKHYVALRHDHPTYAQMDEVYYFLGLAYELQGNAPAARTWYLELIDKAPSSKLVPLAYFAFGELYFIESASDPVKNDFAVQAFTEVLKYPAQENPIYADALLRLGQTHLRRQDDSKAKSMFDRLRRDFPDSPATARIPTGY